MGWPRRDADERLYFERASKSYIMVFHNLFFKSNYECVSEVMVDNDPNSPHLASGGVSPRYLYSKCRRASWNDMPKVWQDAFRPWLNVEPEECRGFWRMAELKEMEDEQQNRT